MQYLAAMGCGFQTGAGTVLNVLKPGVEDSVVVFGSGGVGLAAIMAAKSLGVSSVVAIDILPQKLELARTLGATDTINSKEYDDVVTQVKKVCKRTSGATFSIDCTGVPHVIEQCIECLAPCGTAATVGVPPPGVKISIDALTFLLENKRYIGVIEGDSAPQQFIPQLVKMFKNGQFPVEKLCKVYPAAEFETAISEMHQGAVIKPVIQW